MSKPQSIEQIDRNFKNQTVNGDLVWIDAFDPRLAVRGQGWPQEAYAARSFHRFPARLLKEQTEAVQSLGRCPSSVFVAFRTDAEQIASRQFNGDTGFMAHMPMSSSSGAELYMEEEPGRWLPVGSAIPNAEHRAFERVLIPRRAKVMREFRLYLPLYKAIESLEIGVSPGAVVEPSAAPAGSKPLVVYGTSITQGGCASTTGSDFVSILGRRLGVEMLNFGFSGNGKGEPVMARALAEIDAEMFLLDYLANVTTDLLRETLKPFVATLRAKQPRVPIVLVGNVAYNQLIWDLPRHHEILAKRDYLMKAYLELREAGDEHLYFIDGHGLLPSGLEGMYVDGVHPTSAGFLRMADQLLPQLVMIRARERGLC